MTFAQNRILWSVVIGAVLIGGSAFWIHYRFPAPPVPPSGHLRVVASFFPYAEFARAVALDSADVSELVPAGVEPHDFEPTPRDVEKLYQADIVIINGTGIDAWAEKLVPALEQQGVSVVRMADLVPSLPGEGGRIDPHFWLDPVLAQDQVSGIARAFSEKDSLHADEYRIRRERYVDRLKSIDEAYRGGLAQCRLRSIVTSHDAFTYLAKRYTLEVISIAGLSPNAEPSPKRLAEIADIVKEHHIGFIFFETLASPKLAATIAQETGASTLVFNPVEGSPTREDGSRASYLDLMTENLHNLRIALECL